MVESRVLTALAALGVMSCATSPCRSVSFSDEAVLGEESIEVTLLEVQGDTICDDIAWLDASGRAFSSRRCEGGWSAPALFAGGAGQPVPSQVALGNHPTAFYSTPAVTGGSLRLLRTTSDGGAEAFASANGGDIWRVAPRAGADLVVWRNAQAMADGTAQRAAWLSSDGAVKTLVEIPQPVAMTWDLAAGAAGAALAKWDFSTAAGGPIRVQPIVDERSFESPGIRSGTWVGNRPAAVRVRFGPNGNAVTAFTVSEPNRRVLRVALARSDGAAADDWWETVVVAPGFDMACDGAGCWLAWKSVTGRIDFGRAAPGETPGAAASSLESEAAVFRVIGNRLLLAEPRGRLRIGTLTCAP